MEDVPLTTGHPTGAPPRHVVDRSVGTDGFEAIVWRETQIEFGVELASLG